MVGSCKTVESIWFVPIIVAWLVFGCQDCGYTRRAHSLRGYVFWVGPGRSFRLPGGHRIVLHGKAGGAISGSGAWELQCQVRCLVLGLLFVCPPLPSPSTPRRPSQRRRHFARKE